MRIPVTVLSGYLGAGKTTLLDRILRANSTSRYAVIVNEFGEIGIDHDLVVATEEELFEVNNGCVCCTVRGDLIRTLHELLARPGRFDAVVIETTGLANPGPVAQTLFVDPVLQQQLRLDSIVTLVDARHAAAQWARSPEAVQQVAFADQVILNKTDLASEEELQVLEREIRKLNPLARTCRSERAGVDLEQLLDYGGFDLSRILERVPDFLELPHGEEGHVHDATCAHEGDRVPNHVHRSGISSVSLSSTRAMDADRVQRWLTEVVATQGADILRAKGIVEVAGDARKLVFHAVHSILEGDWQRPWRPGEIRSSRIVFIGHQLDDHALRRGFEDCVASPVSHQVIVNSP